MTEQIPKLKKPRRWRKRLIWTCCILIAIGVIIRVILPLSLPLVLRKIAGIYGMTCTYDKLELNTFSGDAGIWGLQFNPKEGGPPILEADYCHGNLSVLNLFRGRLNVWRLEADGVDVHIDRNPDGHIPLLDRFVSATSNAPITVSAPSTKKATAPGDIDLASPLRVDALRLGHIRVHFHDSGITPAMNTELAMDLRLSDLGALNRPAKFEMNLSIDPMLDSVKITGEGRSGGKTLDATIDVLVRGLRLKTAAAYLAPLGIRPISDSITLKASGRIHTSAAAGNKEGFGGTIVFDHLSATADQQEAMALDRLVVDADVIDTKSIHLARIVLDGVRATAGRAADGNIRVAGIEYDPALATHTVEKPSASSPTPPLLVALMAEPWSLGELAVRNASINLHDQDVMPNVDLSLIADELSAKSIVHDPQHLDTPVTLTGLLHAPGLIRDVKLSGTLQPFLETKTLHGDLAAVGIKPDAIKPYLDQVGLESQLKGGTFTAAVDATLSVGDTLTANVNVPTFDFRDGSPLFALTSFKMSDLTLQPKTGKIGVAAIEVAGPGVSILRNPAGQLSALGLKTKPIVAAAKPVTKLVEYPTSRPADSPLTIASLPHLTIGKFSWKDVRVDFEDQTMSPAVKVSMSDIGVEASNISTELDSSTGGHFKAWLASPSMVKRLELNGNVNPLPRGLQLDASMTSSGINAVLLAPYLKPLGIEPVLHDGGIALHAEANVNATDAGLSASMGLDHLQYTDGPVELAAVDDLQVNGVSLHDGTLGIDSIAINRPRSAASRAADGTLIACGIRLLPPLPVDANTSAIASPLPTTSPAAPPSLPLVVALKKLSVTDANIDWSDQAIQPPVKTSAGASVQLDNFTFGKAAEPGTLTVTAHATGSADKLMITGKVAAAPSRTSTVLDVAATGLRVGALSPYLPPGIGASLKDGQFHTTIDAALSPNADGGIAARLIVGPLTFHDGDNAENLFQWDSVRIIVPRIDLPDHALAIDELSVNGVQTHAEKTADGEFACMGLLLGEKVVPTTQPIAQVPMPTTAPAIAIAPPTTGPSVQDLIASAHRVLPTVTVEKLDLNVSKLTLTDQSRPAASPLVISDLRLHNVNRIDWLGKTAANKPPTHLQFACKVDPLIEHVRVDAIVSPFARQPNLQIDFAATGVHGEGLTDLVPELKSKINGGSMTDGTVTAHLEAEARFDRKNALDFDVSRGLDLNVLLNNVQYRAVPNGPVLAGVEEVRADSIRIQPVESIVHVKTLEITKPIGLFTQDEAGVHALGWVYKISTTQPVEATTQPVVIAKVEPMVAAPPPPPVKPNGEVRIDKLLVSGLDLRVEDNAVQPPMVIPLNGLDVEVRNISTLSPFEDSPIRFSAIVNADKVKLLNKAGQLEDRDLFSQITANGEVSMYPKLHGWAKTSVSGLDLAALRGPAAQFGETLTNGVYDSTVDLRFDPNGAIAVTSRFTLTDLSLSEPPNGPIYRYLHLPAPLDVAIGSVQGADGSISLPINVAVDPNHISYADLGLAAASGISQVIVVAVASAPLKAMNDVGGLIGLGGGPKQPQTFTVTYPFSPGSAAFDAVQTLSPLYFQLKKDPNLTITIRHQIGAGDVRVLSVRANPTKEQCSNLESQLRSRKTQLLDLRADAAGKARADLVSLGSSHPSSALTQLRAIDQQLAATEESLDQVGELLKPGAERLADRRTRTAALQIADERLREIKSTLIYWGIDAERVKSVAAQYNPVDNLDGGQVVVSVVEKK